MYNRLKEKALKKKDSKNEHLSREGYGYIKRRVGLLSNEVKTPSYSATEK